MNIKRLDGGTVKPPYNDMGYITIFVGIHALINVHEYHCIVIRMRCWLLDDYCLLISRSKGLLQSQIN